MQNQDKKDLWVWVIVQDPERDEQFLGQHDEEQGVSFIPVFLEKEQARDALPRLARDRSLTYQPQAVSYADLASHAAGNGFQLYLLDEDGRVLEKIIP